MFLTFIFTCVVIGSIYLIYKYVRTSNRMNLEGKHVVITGGSSGIGKSVAIEAAALGAHVTVISRSVGNLEKTVSEVIRHCKDRQKQKIQYLSLDVTTDYETIKKHLVSLEENVGSIFMLVNCAGMAICGKIEDMSVEDIRHMIDLNYYGSAYPTKALLGGMKSRGEGIIVLVSSQAALMGIYGYGAYGAGKWAIRGLGESLLMEVIGSGVSVTIAYPPDTDTPGFQNEEITKPLETKLISESGSLVSPQTVAKQLIEDALLGKSQSIVGFESWLLATLCLTCWNGLFHAVFQAILLGPLRIILAAYQMHFHLIINRCRRDKETSKKAE